MLVTGGSQGSRTLNNAAARGMGAVCACGRSHPRSFIRRVAGMPSRSGIVFEKSGLPGEVVEFISDMPAAFAEADLVVCRAGASTVSELAAAGRASILVPFPFAADNHQQRNAEAMEREGRGASCARPRDDGPAAIRRGNRADDGPCSDSKLMAAAAKIMAKPFAAQKAADVTAGTDALKRRCDNGHLYSR